MTVVLQCFVGVVLGHVFFMSALWVKSRIELERERKRAAKRIKFLRKVDPERAAQLTKLAESFGVKV